ncbi:hypothetical protein [Actinotalea subterranea]|uniref:hypothetical protein n=1 Tax=Actinotalea subterranea TaxID=2607497 RepID=UPI00319DC7B2
MTIDQQGSRQVGDRVEDLLREVAPVTRGVVRPFERTVGDEVQAVLDDPRAVVDLALQVLRLGGWSIGIGAGRVDVPLPDSVRAAQGPAFIHAREAVEAAKSRVRPVPLAVRGADAALAAEAEAVLVLLGATAARRSPAGWDAVDALLGCRSGGGHEQRQEDVAARLGITQQAVSQRLRTALWAEEEAARPAAARLLSLAGDLGEDAGREQPQVTGSADR